MKAAAKAIALKAVAEETGVMEIKPADEDSQPVAKGMPSYRPALYKLVGRAYTACSCSVGVYCLLASAGILNCGYHHTCADPGCTPSKLPFGLTSDHMPFSLNKNYPDGENLYPQSQLFAISSGFTYTWHNRVGLKFTLDIEQNDDGDTLMTLDTWEQPGYSPQHSVKRRPREGSIAGQEKTYTVQGTSQNGDRGRCTAIFKVQCQEKEPLLAFKNVAGFNPLKFVEYYDYSSTSDEYWKLVLQSPEPDCWTATTGASSGWWHDMLTFGPEMVVAATSDGTASKGLVMKTGSCESPAGGAEKQCLAIANDTMLTPNYGRNPLTGTWTYTPPDAGDEFPSSRSTGICECC